MRSYALVGALSVSLPNAMAGALGVRPRLAGAASGLMGFLQLAPAALWAQGDCAPSVDPETR